MKDLKNNYKYIMNYIKYAIIITIMIIVVSGCSKNNDNSENITEDFKFSCNTTKQVLDVKVIKNNNEIINYKSNQIMEAKTTDTINILVPEEANEIVYELYSNPNYTEQTIDTNVKLIDGWQTSQEFNINLEAEDPGSVVNYYICPEHSTTENSADCVPSCYISNLLIKIVE